MKELLQKKAGLEKRLDDLIRTTDHSSAEDRSRMIEKSGPLLRRMREIEDLLGKQRARLGGLIGEVFAELDSLAKTGSPQQIRALLRAVGDLPGQMFDQKGFEWKHLRKRFRSYQRRYQARRDYVRMLDEIRSSR